MEIMLQKMWIERNEEIEGLYRVQIDTTGGGISGTLLQTDPPSRVAVILVPGFFGSKRGPIVELYDRLAKSLYQKGIATLRVEHRDPDDFESCVLDVMVSAYVLNSASVEHFILVGHSAGAAVAISAASENVAVAGVAALSCQKAHTDAVSTLTPRPLLMIHGSEDDIIPIEEAQDVFSRAGEPKTFQAFKGSHDLHAEHREIASLLQSWIEEVAASIPQTASV